MTLRAIVIDPRDNVVTALDDLQAGEKMSVQVADHEAEVVLVDEIRFGHKFALLAVPVGGDVMKYGEVIGRASCPIAPGEHVHVHNLESRRGRGDLS